MCRVHGPYTAVYGPCTRPVYTTRVHDGARAGCTDVFGRVHGAYTARTRDVYTAVYGRAYDGRAHGRVHDTYTAAYTCLRVQGACTRPCYTAVYGPSTRLKTAVYTAKRPSTRPYTAVQRVVYTAVYGPYRLGPCARPFSAVYTGCVHCPFRPSLVSDIAIFVLKRDVKLQLTFGRLHSAYTTV